MSPPSDASFSCKTTDGVTTAAKTLRPSFEKAREKAIEGIRDDPAYLENLHALSIAEISLDFVSGGTFDFNQKRLADTVKGFQVFTTYNTDEVDENAFDEKAFQRALGYYEGLEAAFSATRQ